MAKTVVWCPKHKKRHGKVGKICNAPEGYDQKCKKCGEVTITHSAQKIHICPHCGGRRFVTKVLRCDLHLELHTLESWEQ